MLTHIKISVIIISTTKQPNLSEAVTPIQLYQLVLDVKSSKIGNQERKTVDIMKYRIITDDGKEILKSETYAGCENYWNACNGIYEDENGEHYIYIEEIK